VRANQELGTTTALITHNAAMAAMADRVIRFADGEISSVEINADKQQPESLSW
jgi:putative ABC transport system ATP-binding protein